MKSLELYKKDKLLIFIIIYGILYILGFFWLEGRDVPIHIVSSKLDNMIPFYEYFIIPYYLWFVYIAFTIIYFILVCKEQEERKQFVFSFCMGMTVFLVVSYIYPNGHNLRPELAGDSIFIQAVRLLHWIDTPTNVLPSMHVFVTVACSVALLRQKTLCNKKWFVADVWICSILIILSTIFLKQHSVVDVACALILNVVCYVLVYKVNYSSNWEKVQCIRKRIIHN